MGCSDTDEQLWRLNIQYGILLEASAVLLVKVLHGHSSSSLILVWQHYVGFVVAYSFGSQGYQ